MIKIKEEIKVKKDHLKIPPLYPKSTVKEEKITTSEIKKRFGKYNVDKKLNSIYALILKKDGQEKKYLLAASDLKEKTDIDLAKYYIHQKQKRINEKSSNKIVYNVNEGYLKVFSYKNAILYFYYIEKF